MYERFLLILLPVSLFFVAVHFKSSKIEQTNRSVSVTQTDLYFVSIGQNLKPRRANHCICSLGNSFPATVRQLSPYGNTPLYFRTMAIQGRGLSDLWLTPMPLLPVCSHMRPFPTSPSPSHMKFRVYKLCQNRTVSFPAATP